MVIIIIIIIIIITIIIITWSRSYQLQQRRVDRQQGEVAANGCLVEGALHHHKH